MQRLQSKFRSFLGVGSPIKPKNTTLLEKRESVHKFCLLVERLVCTSPSFGKCFHYVHSLSPHRDQNIVCERMGAILVMSLNDAEYSVTIHESPAISFSMQGPSSWMCIGRSRELCHSTTKSNTPKYTLRMGFIQTV